MTVACDHLNNTVRLLTATCKVIQGKLQELKLLVDSLCGEVNASLPPTPIPNTWTSVPKTQIAFNNLNQAATFSYIIPSVIPSDAKNILIFAFADLGSPKNGLAGTGGDIIIFTQDGSNEHYEQYMRLTVWKGSWRAQTDNMWFPMPANRRIYITVPASMATHGGFYLDLDRAMLRIILV